MTPIRPNAQTFATDLAAVGPLAAVQPLVGPQGVGVPERLAAVAAEEHLPGVGEHVPPELPLVGEPALAVGAGEGLLPAVDPLVVLEVPFRRTTEHQRIHIMHSRHSKAEDS